MTYLEKMTKELKIFKPLRTYFDWGSHEFDQTNYEEKTNTLQRIATSEKYDLEKVIRLYKKNYNSEGYKHVYRNVKRTLISLTSYLNSGESIDPETLMDLSSKSEKEVIEILNEKLQKKTKNPH